MTIRNNTALCSGPDQSQGNCSHGSLGPTRDFQLAEDMGQVDFDGLDAHNHLIRDLSVTLSGGKQLQYLAFASR
jgi:hypothetical protein